MKLSREENQKFADEVLTPILLVVDTAVKKFDLDRLNETFSAMQSKAGSLRAWPSPETMDKSDQLDTMNDLFEAILEVMKRRKKQKELSRKQARGSAGANILKQLGF